METELKSVRYPYASLEDFLASQMLTVDGALDDGWNAQFIVRGREIHAAVLFADISGFSARTAKLDPTETLAFVNHFFAWITAEALRTRPGIVDKYIGDELMIVFSEEFGSKDPFLDAAQAARWMGQNDAFAFSPHIGIACGKVIVGYVGTPKRYNCSVFGAPVALAARCAGLRPDDDNPASTVVTFPAEEWVGRDFDRVFDRQVHTGADGASVERPHAWQLVGPQTTSIKNMGDIEVLHVVNRAFHLPSQSATEWAREGVAGITAAHRRWKNPNADQAPRGS